MPGSFFRVECDAMHDLVGKLDRAEDQLRDVTAAMKDCTADAMGSSALDGAVGDLAGRMGDKIDKLGETVDVILDRLKACLVTYEQVDQGWQDAFGGGAGGGAAGASAGAISSALDSGGRN